MSMTTAEIRTAFLDFFAQHQHQIVDSSPLIPANDPTLLFTNAGMVQFKETFLGQEHRPYTRAVSSQRCVRAGGKHNDLDNVGYTARHHTFFEMLGNFSFGDYFKQEAIQYAWQFLTEVLKLPKEKLWITVFEEDDEAANIWINTIGVDPQRISKIGAKDNFWSMGDTGPCGPCSEIFYDHGSEVWGGPPGTPEEDGDRYIEIWNLVFMQYNRLADGTLENLPRPSVDTGMGLERIAAVLQHVHSNYDIDLFQQLIKATATQLDIADLDHKSLRVIADHLRSCSFLIADGILPSNEGRGYVLRRILRRAIRHGHLLGAKVPFFHHLVATLCQHMGEAFPELLTQQKVIEHHLFNEEKQFAQTLSRGLHILEQALLAVDHTQKVIPGQLVFKLYDTYGFPADLTADIMRDRGYQIDEAGFDQHMQQQRQLAQQSSKFQQHEHQALQSVQSSEFTGYEHHQFTAKITEIFYDGQSVQQLEPEQHGIVVLDHTPFYAESGGQVGDTGYLFLNNIKIIVSDTQKLNQAIAHFVQSPIELRLGQTVQAEIDPVRRQAIIKNHSATHLLHSVLHQVLGAHVVQKGSLVDHHKLRFDFSHLQAVSAQELIRIEQMVNQYIQVNYLKKTEILPIEEAKARGAMALFGEKYDEHVRVVSFGDVSLELCGGVHVQSCGEIGLFKIISEEGIAAGVRRIEATTGLQAVLYVQHLEETLHRTAHILKGDSTHLIEKATQLTDKIKQQEKQLQLLQQQISQFTSQQLVTQAITAAEHQVLVVALNNVTAKELRPLMDELKVKLSSAVVVLVSTQGEKLALIAGVSKLLSKTIKAGDLIKQLANTLGGKGGGKPELAQGGANHHPQLAIFLKDLEQQIVKSLTT